MEWNRKPVFGVGINDVSEYTRGTKAYLVWKSMLARCYSDYTRKANPAYVGCSVCEEWLVLSVFKKWFDENYIPGTQLDKDIIVRDNKVYSPDTCCFVPQEINKLFKGHTRTKSNLPHGIVRQYRKFRATIRTNGVAHRMSFDNLADAVAFYELNRSQRILDVANRFYGEGKINERTFNAIVKYGMEIHKGTPVEGV